MIDKKAIIEEFVYGLSDEDRNEWIIHRAACDESLYTFIKEMGGFLLGHDGNSIAGGDSLECLWKPICDFWQDYSIKRKFLYMPRRWLKSTNRKWGQIHSYLQNNEIRILTASEVEKRAKDWVGWQGNQILSHARLRWLYPELLVVDRSFAHANPFSSQQILLPRKGAYDATTYSVVGIHGSSQGGHYDLIEPDDICGEKAMDSETVMADAFSWFDNIESLLTDPHIDIIRGTGTHWAEGDLGWYIQNEFPEYQWIVVPALKDEDLEDTSNIRYLQNPEVAHGESNWEERGSTKYYIDMAANPQTQIRFWTQEQNNPNKASGTLNKFDKKWLHFYRIEDREEGTYLICDECDIEVPLSQIRLYGMVDVAGFGETKFIKKGARNALLIGGQPQGMIQKFVVYAWAKRLRKPSKLRQQLYEAHNEYKPRLWRIDTTGVGNSVYADIQEEKRKECPHLRIIPLPSDVTKGVKDSDIQALINPMANGEIHIYQTMKELVGEIQQYPRGLTKDLIDMLGKINRYYWSRKAKIQSRSYAPPDSMSGKSTVGGY
ncbi:MAG: hypothetical protein V3V81_08020 [Candidatus Bathyarchaeia archaeon]